MSPVIRIDDEVYAWLQSKARAFEDTPNSTLRKLAGLDDLKDQTYIKGNSAQKNTPELLPHRISGDKLNREWKVGARQALYHKDGHWFNNLNLFPGALFDPNGYILFKTEQDYLRCKYIKIGKETNVTKGIWSIPGYVKMR
jgi:hypothetical protein